MEQDRDLRTRCLRVGAELAAADAVGEPAFGHLVAQVRLDDVAARLGVGRTALYREWETQHAFRLDLARRLLVDNGSWLADSLSGFAALVGRLDGDLVTATREWFGELQRRIAGDPRLLLRSASLGYPLDEASRTDRRDREAADRAVAGYEVAAALRNAGRRPVAPLEVGDLVVSLTWLVDAVATGGVSMSDDLRHDIDLGPRFGGPWSTLGFAVRCLVVELTEPGELTSAAPTGPDAVPTRDPAPAGVDARGTRRERALRAGAEHIAELVRRPRDEGDPVTAIGHVTLDRVARAAKVSRAHAYRLWPNQAAFRTDLAGYIGDQERSTYLDEFDHAAGEAVASTLDPEALALRICEQVNEHRHDGSPDVPMPGLAFNIEFNHPEVVRRRRAEMKRSIDGQQLRLDVLADALQLAPRPGLTTRDLASLLILAAFGSERLHRVDRSAIRTGLAHRGGRWSSFSIACEAFVAHTLADDR